MFKDEKFEARQNDYRKCKFNLLEQREKNHLTLRKEKIDAIIFEKRLKKISDYKYNDNDIYSHCKNLLDLDSFNRLNTNLVKIFSLDEEKFITNFHKEIDLIFESLKLDDHNKTFSIFLLRIYSCNKNANLQIFILHDVLHLLQIFLNSETSGDIIYEIYWILTNISYLGSYDENSILLNENFLPIHSIFLKSEKKNYELIEQIIWMLRNVVSDHVSLRDSFLKSQLMDDILELINISLQAKKISTIKTSLFLLYDCLKHENINLEDVKLVNSIYKMFPIFENLIFINDDEVFICCLFSLKIISSVEDPTNQLKIQKMFLQNDGEIINLLLAINYNECKFELLETIRILGNLLSVEDNNFIDNLLEYDILKFFKSVFDNEKSKKMRRETIWAISNITGGSYKHIKTIVDSDLFEEIIKMTSDYDFSTRKEAVYALFNMCVDISLSLGTELVKKGIFEVFIKVIEKNVDNSIIELALESIDKILNTGEPLREIAGFNSMAKKFDEVGGINCLEQLQKHPNQKIYEKTLNILDKYYETKDVDHNVLDLDNQSSNSGNNSSVIFNENNLNNIHSSNPNYNFFGPNGAVELQNGDRNSYPNQINSMHTNYQFR